MEKSKTLGKSYLGPEDIPELSQSELKEAAENLELAGKARVYRGDYSETILLITIISR